MSGTMIVGNGIPLYRLMVLRSAVKLETKGMKMSRGPSATKRVKDEFGIKGNREKVLSHLETLIKEAKAKLQPGDITKVG